VAADDIPRSVFAFPTDRQTREVLAHTHTPGVSAVDRPPWTKWGSTEMANQLARVVNEDDGMSTAEYAVGTVAAAGFGGLLLKLLQSPDVQELLWSVVQRAFSWLG
jgi:hypothetical protein